MESMQCAEWQCYYIAKLEKNNINLTSMDLLQVTGLKILFVTFPMDHLSQMILYSPSVCLCRLLDASKNPSQRRIKNTRVLLDSGVGGKHPLIPGIGRWGK